MVTKFMVSKYIYLKNVRERYNNKIIEKITNGIHIFKYLLRDDNVELL